MSLCFLEAGDEYINGTLSIDQYIAHLVAHFRQDVYHDGDQQRGKSRPSAKEFRRMELYAQSIRYAAVVRHDYERLESTTQLESMFQACLTGDVEAIRNTYEELQHPEQVPFLPALATFAVQRKQAGVLEFCFEKDVVADQYLSAAVKMNHDIGIFEILYAANWKKMQESPRVLESMARELIQRKGTSEELEWFLDRGAVIRGATVQKVASFSYRPPATLMQKLLQVDSKAARNPEALAYAASRGFAEIVQQMLEGGLAADATSSPVHLMDLAREGPGKTALFHAVSGDNGDLKITDDHLETAKILLDNGANPNMICGYNHETPLSVALNFRRNKRAMTKLLLSYPNNL